MEKRQSEEQKWQGQGAAETRRTRPRGRGARIKRWLALRLGLLVVIATTTIYRNLSGQKCARTEAYKLFGDLRDERWCTRRRGPDRLARQVGNLRCGLKQKFPDVFFIFICTTCQHYAKRKRRGPKYKELNGQSVGHATGQEAWLSSQGVHKMASECGGCHCKCYKSVWSICMRMQNAEGREQNL